MPKPRLPPGRQRLRIFARAARCLAHCHRRLRPFAGFDGVDCETASGRHLRLARPLSQLWAPAGQWHAGLPPPACSSSDHPEVAALARWFPQQTLFLDLETCGFAGSMVFLVGLVWHDGGTLVIDQLFARNYAEERPVLETLWSIVRRSQVLVTFNGKSFDWPMVCDRSTRHHLRRGYSAARAPLTCAIPAGRIPAAGPIAVGTGALRPVAPCAVPLEAGAAGLPFANAGAVRLPPRPSRRSAGRAGAGGVSRIRAQRPHRSGGRHPAAQCA